MTERYRIARTENKKRYGFGVEQMKKIKVCVSCGTVAKASRIFCPECRKLLPKDTVYSQYRKRHRVCRACGQVVSDHMQFCPGCGQKLEQ